MIFYDAHNHLQDERFGDEASELMETARSVGVAGMVVNGSCESDWGEVDRLARLDRGIIPSFGLHPWYVSERSNKWIDQLELLLRQHPRAGVGEIGLDRWKTDLRYDDQENVFLAQWVLAREMDRPASIHCLKCWGRLLELMRGNPPPARGFLLHSYGGPHEMIGAFAHLGAYFSFPGYYLHQRKANQREAFRHVPPDRLLIETDAPDQMLPVDQNNFPLHDSSGNAINHPANLAAVYAGVAQWLDIKLEELASRVEQNYLRLFVSI